jgi:hypothetical protein
MENTKLNVMAAIVTVEQTGCLYDVDPSLQRDIIALVKNGLETAEATIELQLDALRTNEIRLNTNDLRLDGFAARLIEVEDALINAGLLPESRS